MLIKRNLPGLSFSGLSGEYVLLIRSGRILCDSTSNNIHKMFGFELRTIDWNDVKRNTYPIRYHWNELWAQCHGHWAVMVCPNDSHSMVVLDYPIVVVAVVQAHSNITVLILLPHFLLVPVVVVMQPEHTWYIVWNVFISKKEFLTWAAITRCRSAISVHFAHTQSRHRQYLLWPFNALT